MGDPIDLTEGVPVDFLIDPESDYSSALATGDDLVGNGLLLPSDPGEGFYVTKIFVAVELETPSILISNPDGVNNKAHSVAEQIEYYVTPIVTVDEPPPIAFNGTILDQSEAIRDHDPTTTQDFEDTEVERAMDAMDAGGGMTLTMSFLDEDQVSKLSSALYDYMNSGTGTEATYVCGPNCSPDLGGVGPNGGIINSITYSYQDSNSYTISVNCGQKLMGGDLAQVEGSISFKATESYSAKGTVVQDAGNNAHFKVRIDGYGERFAVNMCPAVIRVGDKVNVTVNNVAVEK
jgi:hypothetical protein